MREQRAEEIFHQVLDLDPEERESFLEGSCAEEEAVLEEVRSLLRGFDRSKILFDGPAYLSAEGSQPVASTLSVRPHDEVEDENDAAQVEAGISPLLWLARETNVAVWAIHQTRKSGGDYGLDFRGSDALIATVDIAISMQRPKYQDEPGQANGEMIDYHANRGDSKSIVVFYRSAVW